jgi:homoserine dehydrogenase
LDRGYSVATANKLPLTGDQATFNRLVGSGRFRYESTVGSAVPAIETVYALKRAGDNVARIRGIFSGTLSFLGTGLQAGERFSALVADAVGRGATEPEPRIDLSGLDMARKSLILARTLGWQMDLADVTVRSLIPAEYAEIPLDEFMARLPELDAGFIDQVAETADKGHVLRFVADLSEAGIDVGLRPVPADSPLGHLSGSDNLFEFQTDYYPAEPLVLQGRGKGVEAAAAGVHADIIALASRRTYL